MRGIYEHRCAETGAAADNAKPFSVEIRTGSKSGYWGNYRTLEAAAEIAARLRRHGMDAHVIEEPTL